MKKKSAQMAKNSIHQVERRIFFVQLLLIILLAVLLGYSGIMINIHFETKKRDQNLQNVSQAIATSPMLDDITKETNTEYLTNYFDSLQKTLGDIDVISIVNADKIRLYHTNHTLIDTMYNGTIPDFRDNDFYTEDNSGPSGRQRRAYAAIYDKNGDYKGFVIAVMLKDSIKKETMHTILVFFIITAGVLLIEFIISARFFKYIKKKLNGYEIEVFSAMFQVRDNILESLAEGIIAVDKNSTIQFVNSSALKMLRCDDTYSDTEIVGQPLEKVCDPRIFQNTLSSGEKEFGVHESKPKNSNIIVDRIPIKKENDIVGAVGILHNREEYTKLMEDLAGTRYLVDSMRANNHDFTNKLHVILGLIQMEMYDKATEYIENITIVQRETISRIISAVDEPAVAALLIGKIARASELNIKFVLHEGTVFAKNDYPIPVASLITIIGNIIDNAFEAMNEANSDLDVQKEFLFGIYSKNGALLITANDMGVGIKKEDIAKVFLNGYSTKGDGRGTGLYHVKKIIENLGGAINIESEYGTGTSITVSFGK